MSTLYPQKYYILVGYFLCISLTIVFGKVYHRDIERGKNMVFGIFATACLLMVGGFLFVRCTKGACPLAVVLKSIASLIFVFAGIFATFKVGLTTANMFILFGLILALFGDIVLDLKIAYKEHEKFYLNTGMISFSLSSATYIVATILIWHSLENFLLAGLGSFALACVFGIVVLMLEKTLKLDFSGYKIQTFIYSTLVSMAGILSLIVCFFAPKFAIFAVGVLLVLISDLVLSLMYFGGKGDSKVLCVVNHVLYYLGELLVVAYLFFQLG